MYDNDLEQFKKFFLRFTFSDKGNDWSRETIYNTNGYIAEPHGTVGYLGLKKKLRLQPQMPLVF
jgi:threonine synthase